MSEELKENLHDESSENEESRVYEIGYWLAPTIAEESLSGEVSKIKALLSDHGAQFISEEDPKMRDISYTFTKIVSGQRIKFDKGYFGWIKMELTPENAEKVKEEIEHNDFIIRYLIIKTVRENTMTPKRTSFRTEGSRVEKSADAEVLAEQPKEKEIEKVSEEEIDQEIDSLVI